MKVVILAGGLGTRISEESIFKPKPMIEIGDKPILWHIMKIYSSFGFNEFVICAGYKQQVIKEWFNNYFLYNSDITLDFKQDGEMIIHSSDVEPWKVTIADTGHETMTGGRIKRVRKYVQDKRFMLTYGDGVGNINIKELLKFHIENKKLVTMSCYQPEGRFGVIDIGNKNEVTNFKEKKRQDSGWINIGFMVIEPEIFDYIEGDNTIFEKEPLMDLAKAGELAAYKHEKFWQCMDTVRDKEKLESLWVKGQAPWKIWS